MTKKYILIVIIVVLILSIILFFYKNSENGVNYEDINNVVLTEENNIKEKNNTKEEVDSIIKIHIYGEVNNPGLIELNSGDRVLDAIEIAGGLTPNADSSKVNLAYILSDGEKIYIPNINEEYEEQETMSTSSSSKVNINIATEEELKSLNGIGESLASSIVEYRKSNGKFSNIEDIKNVSGIGDNKFEKIKDDICVK